MSTTVRVMQEDWGVFQNLPATAKRFTEQTGIEVEVTLTVIPEMWELMERSFSGEDPPFDLVGVDDLLLIQAARAGHVEPIDELVEADGYLLDDFPPAAIDALTDAGRIWGLPYCYVSNILIYRADLFDRFGIAVPETLDELTEASVSVQEAVRAEGNTDFYGMAIRGAPNCGLNFWIVGSTWGPSFGARWYDDDGRPTLATPELIAAVEDYVDLVRRTGPPESPTMDFMDCMRCYGSGRAAMTIEPANEASILYDEGGRVAEGTRTALIPAGPLGTRHVGLYTPPYAIPSLSRSKQEAWELAKFLCAPEQVLEDAERSGFVEVARESVLRDPRFVDRFRPELVRTTVETRPYARGERPVTSHGMEVGNLIGDEIVRVLKGELGAREAMENAERTVGALGPPN
jgi:ABC-type glycerol-3-phosphate transport system substrate-binding protein